MLKSTSSESFQPFCISETSPSIWVRYTSNHSFSLKLTKVSSKSEEDKKLEHGDIIAKINKDSGMLEHHSDC